MDNMLEIRMLYRFTTKDNDEGFIAMGVDIRRGMAEPMHILLRAAVVLFFLLGMHA